MATFEQALHAAFGTVWEHSLKVESVRTDDRFEDPSLHETAVLVAESAFIGSLDTLGRLLEAGGLLPSFQTSIADDGEWMKDSTAALGRMMDWAHAEGRISPAEYAGYRAVYGRHQT